MTFVNSIGFGRCNLSSLTMALALAAILSACAKRQDNASAAEGDAPAPVAEEGQPSSTNDMQASADSEDTNEVAMGIGRRLQESPFAVADPALKESYARALIAYKIGDYPRALAELEDLAAAGGLDAPQQKALQDLLRMTTNAAPELMAGNSAKSAQTDNQAPVYAIAPENAPPFSTADPAVKESFAAAELAFKIGDYDRALSELRTLSTNALLNSQQKYAVQLLLSRTPQTLPGAR